MIRIRFIPALLAATSILFAGSLPADEATTTDPKELREAEQKITDLKDSVFQAKTRLRELEEAVLRGKITGSKAFITFDNQAEGFFALNSAEFYLDNQLVYKIDTNDGKKTVEGATVYDSDLPAGDHVLNIKLLYQGSDKSVYQMFPYFKEHKVQLDSSEKFSVEYGKTTLLKLVALDKGYFKSDLKERLYLQVQSIRDWGTDSTETNK